MDHILEIQAIRNLTHDVKQIRLAKPEGYTFTPGQATEVAVNREGWTDEKPSGDDTCLDGVIDKAFLKSHINDMSQAFYVCGPDPFNESIMAALEELGANPDANGTTMVKAL